MSKKVLLSLNWRHKNQLWFWWEQKCVSHYKLLKWFTIDRLKDCEPSSLIDGVEKKKPSAKLDQNIFNFLKYHSWPFISTQLRISHVHLIFSYCARGRSQSSGRRCGWPTPHSQGNTRHYPLQISSKENNNHELYLWYSNQHSIQIIFLMLKISPTWTFIMNSTREKQIRPAFS